MSQVPSDTLLTSSTPPGDLGGSATSPEKSASASATATASIGSFSPRSGGATGAATQAKPRSCVTCRSRKVRCDKTSPCSNCRRAGIACVFPSLDRPPRWARRLERIAGQAQMQSQSQHAQSPAQTHTQQDPDQGVVSQVMERLRNLEGLVKELSGQLDQAHAAAANAKTGASVGGQSPQSSTSGSNQNRGHEGIDHHAERTSSSPSAAVSTNTSNVQGRFGRLVIGDANRSRYVSSGFWSRVNDELDGLKIDAEGLADGEYDSSEDEDSSRNTPSTQELQRPPAARHAFLFRHNLSSPEPDLREFQPLPSQVPFLLDVFAENVNLVVQLAHMPTVHSMMRDLRGSDQTALTPANEALMFAIYYAAVTSMEEEDIITNFGASKSELNLKYRLGLEHALAKADFLNVPDVVLVQAFAVFLFLLRRHDSPRFVWMMTGLVIRMAQSLGLHRDGAHFPHLTPFQVEMRRRVWWALCMLDARASEDQGTELTISYGSFDTRLPLNIDDGDIGPGKRDVPKEREGLTDMTLPRLHHRIVDVQRRMMAEMNPRDGRPPAATTLDNQSRLLDEVFEHLDHSYLRYFDSAAERKQDLAYWVNVTVTRLVVSKMTLLIYLPALLSSSSPESKQQQISDPEALRAKLFIAALEVAEYNHTLNAERACRSWRWIFQTYTHWHAVVHLLLAVTAGGRPWSPASERAWVALHSAWLVPAHVRTAPAPTSASASAHEENLGIWVPLRRLMARARRHRDAELARLRGDPEAARHLLQEDKDAPQPASCPGPLPANADPAEFFRERWRALVELSEGSVEEGDGARHVAVRLPRSEYVGGPAVTDAPEIGSASWHGPSFPQAGPGSVYAPPGVQQGDSGASAPGLAANPHSLMSTAQQQQQKQQQPVNHIYGPSHSEMTAWSEGRSLGPGFTPWLWADNDPSVDVFAHVDVDAAVFGGSGGGGAMDLDTDVDWNTWLQSVRGMESSGEPPAGGWI